MKFYFPLLALILLILSCSKQNDSSTLDKGDFLMSKSNVYLNETLFISLDNNTSTNISWDFGDGSSLTSADAPTHIYTKAGVYTITMTKGTFKKSHKVRVYPGVGSFQIKSSVNIAFKYPSYEFFRAGDTHDVISPQYKLPAFTEGVITDTLFFTRPSQLTYDPPMKVHLDFTNYYGTTIYFTTYNFNLQTGTHRVFEILGTTTGDYSYKTQLGYYVDSFGRLTDVVGIQ